MATATQSPTGPTGMSGPTGGGLPQTAEPVGETAPGTVTANAEGKTTQEPVPDDDR